MRGEPASVALEGESVVVVTRAFAAPRERVWRAYTEPALVQQWLLGPPGWSMPVCEMDVRPGGEFRWWWRSDADGSGFGFHGEFQEVEAPSLLRHTEHFDVGDTGFDMGGDPAMITVRFDAAGQGTTVITRIDYATRATRDAALATGMTDGMETSYQLLDDLLADDAAA